MTRKKLTVREAIREAIREEMHSDNNIFVLGEEVAEYNGAYKVTQGLLDEFGPKRVVDTPITEHGFTGLAIGAAFNGLKPIVEFMTFNFAMQAIDQIVNSAAKTYYMSGGQVQCPIVFRGPNGPAARVAAQHSQCYAAWYSSIPGLKVISPYSAADSKGLLKSAIRDQNPVVFLENELLYGLEFEEEYHDDHIVEIGKAKIVREGTNITIICFSLIVHYALEAAKELKEKYNIDAEIIDIRTIKPLDEETIISSIKKTNYCLTVEEGFRFSGIGSEISSIITSKAFDYLDGPVERLASIDAPLPYANNLEKLALPKANNIIDKTLEILNVKDPSITH